MTLTDSLGRVFKELWVHDGPMSQNCYSMTTEDMRVQALNPDQRMVIAFRVLGQMDREANAYTLHIIRAGRVENARWRIPVPR